MRDAACQAPDRLETLARHHSLFERLAIGDIDGGADDGGAAQVDDRRGREVHPPFVAVARTHANFPPVLSACAARTVLGSCHRLRAVIGMDQLERIVAEQFIGPVAQECLERRVHVEQLRILGDENRSRTALGERAELRLAVAQRVFRFHARRHVVHRDVEAMTAHPPERQVNPPRLPRLTADGALEAGALVSAELVPL